MNDHLDSLSIPSLEALLASRKLGCSRRMAHIIAQICCRHHLALAHIGGHLGLEMPGFEPLVIEIIDHNLAAVAHYVRHHGDAVADPEIVFWTGLDDDRWIPIEISQPQLHLLVADQVHVCGGWRRCAEVQHGCLVAIHDYAGIRDLCALANTWAGNLQVQGWLERGLNAQASSAWPGEDEWDD